MVPEKAVRLKKYSREDYELLPEPKYIRFKFRKTGDLQYVSHLDLQTVMGRVLIRAKAPLWYSKGYNPHPKLIFALPLSVGVQGECEYLDVRVERAVPPRELMEHINAEVTDELRFLDAYYAETSFSDIYWSEYEYTIRTEGADEAMAQGMQDVLTAEHTVVQKKVKDKRGNISYKDQDIAPYIRDVRTVYENGEIRIRAVLSASINQTHPHINPDYLIAILKREMGILQGSPLDEYYDIIRKRVYLEDAQTDFK